MKFLHLGDLHLGKTIYQQNLLDIQIDLLNQVIQYSRQNQIKTLVLAGDIYDRAVASSETIDAFNHFIDICINQEEMNILMIAGNHDSASRLDFGSHIMAKQGLHIVAFPQKEMKPIVIEGVHFYLVPFFKPSAIRHLYDNYELNSYQDAFAYYMDQQDIDFQHTNVLVTHQFISGNSEVIRSDSESLLNVGGSEIIGVDLVKDFDYVALGHLHAGQKVSKETIRYSGSLMRYSFDEMNQAKGMVEVEIQGKDVTYKQVELHPIKDLYKYSDTFEHFKDRNDIDCQQFIGLELQDKSLIVHAKDQLKDKYPYILQITYPSLIKDDTQKNTKANIGFEKKNPVELLDEFYEKMTNQHLSQKEKDIVCSLLEEGDHHDAS